MALDVDKAQVRFLLQSDTVNRLAGWGGVGVWEDRETGRMGIGSRG